MRKLISAIFLVITVSVFCSFSKKKNITATYCNWSGPNSRDAAMTAAISQAGTSYVSSHAFESYQCAECAPVYCYSITTSGHQEQ